MLEVQDGPAKRVKVVHLVEIKCAKDTDLARVECVRGVSSAPGAYAGRWWCPGQRSVLHVVPLGIMGGHPA